jgi:hypothetical protein
VDPCGFPLRPRKLGHLPRPKSRGRNQTSPQPARGPIRDPSEIEFVAQGNELDAMDTLPLELVEGFRPRKLGHLPRPKSRGRIRTHPYRRVGRFLTPPKSSSSYRAMNSTRWTPFRSNSSRVSDLAALAHLPRPKSRGRIRTHPCQRVGRFLTPPKSSSSHRAMNSTRWTPFHSSSSRV